MKKFIVLSITMIFTIFLTACGSSNVFTYILDSSYDGFITMGTSADYPPYEWPKKVDGKQTLVGIDIEIAKEIAHVLNKNLKVINKGFDFLLEDLANGKVDFVIAGMTPTEDRSKIVDFSNIYYQAEQVILIKETKLDTYNSFDALNKPNVKIGAQLGSIQQDIATTFINAQHQFIQSVPNLVLRVKDGQIDAVILEKPVASGFVSNQSGLAIANITLSDNEDGQAVAVKKGNQELLDVVNSVINELITSGKMDKIVSDMVLLNSEG